jgi:dihydropteroate synthase
MTATDYQIMGIVNVTPDSFSDGGQFSSVDAAVEHTLQLVEDGAHILDIGGESTRPGAQEVPVEEELARTIPVIETLASKTDAQISIDTRKPAVARAAKQAGAHIWNDVSALTFAEDSLSTAVELQLQTVLMHAQGLPETMQDNPSYEDVVTDVATWLSARVEACVTAGLPLDKLIIDPGIGFGKTLDHNLALLGALDQLGKIAPVLLGASRKSFIAAIDEGAPADQRLGGSLAAVLAGMSQGVRLFRVHDVAETRQALQVWSAIDA